MAAPRPQKAASGPTPANGEALPPSSTATEPPKLEEWSEDQYIHALAHLETLQNQLDELRLTLPSIVHSLTSPYPDPQTMYTCVRQTTLEGSRALDVFRKTYESPGTRDVMLRVRGSWAGSSDVTAAGEQPDWGWIEKSEALKRSATKENIDNKNLEDTSAEGNKKEAGKG